MEGNEKDEMTYFIPNGIADDSPPKQSSMTPSFGHIGTRTSYKHHEQPAQETLRSYPRNSPLLLSPSNEQIPVQHTPKTPNALPQNLEKSSPYYDNANSRTLSSGSSYVPLFLTSTPIETQIYYQSHLALSSPNRPTPDHHVPIAKYHDAPSKINSSWLSTGEAPQFPGTSSQPLSAPPGLAVPHLSNQYQKSPSLNFLTHNASVNHTVFNPKLFTSTQSQRNSRSIGDPRALQSDFNMSSPIATNSNSPLPIKNTELAKLNAASSQWTSGDTDSVSNLKRSGQPISTQYNHLGNKTLHSHQHLHIEASRRQYKTSKSLPTDYMEKNLTADHSSPVNFQGIRPSTTNPGNYQSQILHRQQGKAEKQVLSTDRRKHYEYKSAMRYHPASNRKQLERTKNRYSPTFSPLRTTRSTTQQQEAENANSNSTFSSCMLEKSASQHWQIRASSIPSSTNRRQEYQEITATVANSVDNSTQNTSSHSGSSLQENTSNLKVNYRMGSRSIDGRTIDEFIEDQSIQEMVNSSTSAFANNVETIQHLGGNVQSATNPKNGMINHSIRKVSTDTDSEHHTVQLGKTTSPHKGHTKHGNENTFDAHKVSPDVQSLKSKKLDTEMQNSAVSRPMSNPRQAGSGKNQVASSSAVEMTDSSTSNETNFLVKKERTERKKGGNSKPKKEKRVGSASSREMDSGSIKSLSKSNAELNSTTSSPYSYFNMCWNAILTTSYKVAMTLSNFFRICYSMSKLAAHMAMSTCHQVLLIPLSIILERLFIMLFSIMQYSGWTLFRSILSTTILLMGNSIVKVLKLAVFGVIRSSAVVVVFHRAVIRIVITHNHIGFCFAFLYSFPFLANTVQPWAPPWAPVCLWYAFLVQLFCSSTLDSSKASNLSSQSIKMKNSMIRVGLSLAFLMEGVSHHSFLLDLTGAELLLMAFMLSVIKLSCSLTNLLSPIFFVSFSLQVLSAILIGSSPSMQWLQLTLSIYSLQIIISYSEYEKDKKGTEIGRDDKSGFAGLQPNSSSSKHEKHSNSVSHNYYLR